MSEDLDERLRRIADEMVLRSRALAAASLSLPRGDGFQKLMATAVSQALDQAAKAIWATMTVPEPVQKMPEFGNHHESA